MLAKDPAQRYPVPGRAAQALQAFLVTGHEPVPPEKDPKMCSYLTWLEMEGDGQRARQASQRDLPAATAAPGSAAGAAVSAGRRRARRQKRERVKTAISLPAKPPPGAAAKEFDVELVPMPVMAGAVLNERSRLGRRDFVVFGLGVGSVILAILVGWIMALILRNT
jgi:hypothetical protein